MGKDPAFLFYPGDWLGGTIGMTLEQKGAYLELLMLQFNRGHMTKDMIGQTIGHLWVTVQDKFMQDDKGLWYNERLDIEKEKRKNFVSSRRNNKEGKNQYKKEVGHMTSHMENENRDVIDNIIIVGAEGKNSISVKAKYAGEKPVRIYDLQEYFSQKGQLKELTMAGWTKFTPFMKVNPAGVFEDHNHLYQAFKKYSTNPAKNGVSSKLH